MYVTAEQGVNTETLKTAGGATERAPSAPPPEKVQYHILPEMNALCLTTRYL